MKTTGIEAFARIEIPADIGKNQLATLKCKVDTGAGGNIMPLRTFAKLFQKDLIRMETPLDSAHPPHA